MTSHTLTPLPLPRAPEDEIRLKGAYSSLHLTEESEKLLRDFLAWVDAHGAKIKPDFHLTLDYLGNIHSDTLEDIIFATRFMTGWALQVAGEIGSVKSAKHFVSHATGENIIYLPVACSTRLFERFWEQGYTIKEPHITLMEGKNMTDEVIEKVIWQLALLETDALRFDTTAIYGHGKDESGNKYVGKFSVRSI